MDVEVYSDCRGYFVIVSRSYGLGDTKCTERSFVLEVDFSTEVY